MEKKQVATMRDSNGNDIPLKYVSKYDKAKDKAVRKILARFVKARHALESVVAETVAELGVLGDGLQRDVTPVGVALFRDLLFHLCFSFVVTCI